MRILRQNHGFLVQIGPWLASFSWGKLSHYANGSRWFSGWHRWQEDGQ